MNRIFAIAVLLGVFASVLSAEQEVKIINRHRMSMPPFYLVFSVQIARHELNRGLCIWWGNVEWDKSLWNKSCIQLDGLATRRTYHYPVSNARIIRESGEWAIEAELIRSDKSFRDRSTVMVGGIPEHGGF